MHFTRLWEQNIKRNHSILELEYLCFPKGKPSGFWKLENNVLDGIAQQNSETDVRGMVWNMHRHRGHCVGMSSPTNKSNLAYFVNGVMKLVDEGFQKPSES